MADARISEHARLIVDYCCKVKRDDFVLIVGTPEAQELVAEMAAKIGRAGAHYVFLDQDPYIERAYRLSADDQTLSSMPIQILELARSTDVIVQIISSSNSQEESDVPPGKVRLASGAMGQVIRIMLGKRWNVTLHPTRALAQDAKMSFEGYRNFVYNATLRDWPKLVSEMTVLRDKMAAAKQVRLIGKETDIAFSIEGRTPVVDGGEVNLPGGEVFVSPVDSTVSGTVYFDLPVVYADRDIKGARLTFRNGEAVESDAEVGSDLLREMLTVDDGAKRIGELGIGMNRGIDRFTRNILFDEKMRDTIHMAVGNAYEETGGTNKSAIHIDMIKSMKEGGAVYFDGIPVYENGKFVWE
ncbi:MAG TPA: aminopeptidase [Nitrososphaerales archaeon]|nr:aminopeptidase [Nitrososphaerales archaeon]